MTSRDPDGQPTGRIEAALRGVPFLNHLPSAPLHALVQRGEMVGADAGQTVFHEGDAADRLYIIVGGTVRVERRSASGRSLSLALLGPGAVFGEIALLDGGTRSASVVTLTPCEFFTLGRTGFFALLADAPPLIPIIFSDLTGKIRETTEKLFREEIAARALQVELDSERLAALSQLVAAVARELNAPLGGAKTASEIIGRSLEADALRSAAASNPAARLALEDAEGAAALLQRNVARASELVRSFGNLAVGHAAEVKESLSLPNLVHETLDLYRISARFSALTFEVSDALPAGQRTWTGYRADLTRVLLCLLENAEQYAYAMGGPVAIGLTAGARGGAPAFVVSVQDYGAGIAPEHLPHVFDPFYTTSRAQGSSGLGLTIVHTTVTQALNGNVAIASEPGRGTTVTITVPQVIAG